MDKYNFFLVCKWHWLYDVLYDRNTLNEEAQLCVEMYSDIQKKGFLGKLDLVIQEKMSSLEFKYYSE